MRTSWQAGTYSEGLGEDVVHDGAREVAHGPPRIVMLAAVWRDPDGAVHALPPCGRCREFLRLVSQSNLEAGVVLGLDQVVKLKDLLPSHGWSSQLLWSAAGREDPLRTLPARGPRGRVEPMDDGSGSVNGTRSGITEAAHQGDERTTLLGVLQRQRDLVAWKLAGVPDPVLGSVATPSGMSLHGLVRHLTNVERSWLRDVFAGQADLHYDSTDGDPDGEWRVPAGTTMTELLTAYAEESRRCDDVVRTAASLDARSASRDMSLRWILLHLVEETARHLGHVDLLREQADGSTGEEPTT